MMKTTTIPQVLLFCWFLSFPAQAVTDEPPEMEESAPAVTIGAGTDIVSRYVTRGVAVGEGAALQTGVWASGKNLTLTVWNNMPLARADGRGRVNEWDTTLAWERPWRGATVEVAATRFAYPQPADIPDTTELTLCLTRPVGEVELSILGLADVDSYPGAAMVEIGATRAWDLSPRLGLEATASLLWGNRRFHEANSGAAGGGIGTVGTALSLPYDLGRGLLLRPHVEWHALPDHQVRAAVGESRYFVVGLSLETAD